MSKQELLGSRVATAFYGRFPHLRPAQEAAIEPLLAGQNVMVAASTGSGKTEAVVAPLISRYWRESLEMGSLVLLYIAPTKALVNDLEKRLHLPLAAVGLRVGLRHGDRDDLTSGPKPNVLVTTPESLEVLILREDPALAGVRAVVVDEAHLLYNTQRGLQLSILLKRLERKYGYTLQWAAASATIGDLEAVRDFLFGPLAEAVFIRDQTQRNVDAQVIQVSSEDEFLAKARRWMAGPCKLLMFANSRKECERLAEVLQRDPGIKPYVFTHYSSLSSSVRIETERNFALARTAICIATSTLELGIDIGDIDAVILWGLPGGVESFLQRIGRSNRRSATNTTVVRCIIPDTSLTPLQDALGFTAIIDAAQRGELATRAPYYLFGAVGQQLISSIVQAHGAYLRVTDLCELMQQHTYLDRATIESILGELGALGYLQPHGFKNRYGADQRAYKLADYRQIYGNFPAGETMVDVCHGSRVLGAVPAANIFFIERGASVRFAGRVWRVLKVTPETIVVDPVVQRGEIQDFRYFSGGIHLDSFVTNRMWSMLVAGVWPPGVFTRVLSERLTEVSDVFRAACKLDNIPFIRTRDGYWYLTFAGELVNKAIALYSGEDRADISAVSIKTRLPITWSSIPTDPDAYLEVLQESFRDKSGQSLFQMLLPDELQKQEKMQEWLKDEHIRSVLGRLQAASPASITERAARSLLG
ncbi:MAG: DEAD/DEAH box helicase [Chloroflexota bacterium]